MFILRANWLTTVSVSFAYLPVAFCVLSNLRLSYISPEQTTASTIAQGRFLEFLFLCGRPSNLSSPWTLFGLSYTFFIFFLHTDFTPRLYIYRTISSCIIHEPTPVPRFSVWPVNTGRVSVRSRPGDHIDLTPNVSPRRPCTIPNYASISSIFVIVIVVHFG